MTDEWQQRRKYCAYKAGSILKALKNGEKPERGNPFAPPEEEKKAEDMPVQGDPIAPSGVGEMASTMYQPQS